MAENGKVPDGGHARHNFVGYPTQKAMQYGKETRKNDSTGINKPIDDGYNASSKPQSKPGPSQR